jgi:hypothetical protein
MTRYLNRREQVEYLKGLGLKISKPQLDKLACKGGGPEYQIWGNQAVSTPEQLDAWVDAKLTAPRRSTSDHRVETSATVPTGAR